MNLHSAGLTIGELADRTGVGVSTLRAWESRYGFPVPLRLPSGHRRYGEGDVAAIAAITRERAAGSSLEAAVARARARVRGPRSSVFATLREALADVTPAVLSHASMLTVSQAIEDEAVARAVDPVIFGFFQQEESWRRRRARWQALSVRSVATVSWSTITERTRRERLWEIPLPSGSPMTREWAVICDSASFSACLSGVERVSDRQRPRHRRAFEALWTVEPAPVRQAARAACALAADAELDRRVAERLGAPAIASYDTIRAATTLTNRIVGYLERARAVRP